MPTLASSSGGSLDGGDVVVVTGGSCVGWAEDSVVGGLVVVVVGLGEDDVDEEDEGALDAVGSPVAQPAAHRPRRS